MVHSAPRREVAIDAPTAAACNRHRSAFCVSPSAALIPAGNVVANCWVGFGELLIVTVGAPLGCDDEDEVLDGERTVKRGDTP